MIRPPFAARVALGIAVTVVEEARRLPTTAISLPMTAVSEVLQTAMRLQQTVTELAIKGDQVFSLVGGRPDDKAEWATFDDDAVDAPASAYSDVPLSTTPEPVGDTAGEIDVPDPVDAGVGSSAGRFALYSTPPSEVEATDRASAAALAPAPTVAPEIVEYLDYDSLTLAQLRARLRTLSVEDLSSLLQYETSASNRAPYRTMLENRITTARAK
ncbi:MAG: lipid droplet-associated protein [Rhodococcus sp. (in: high G+C Gram-positive bacteria)]